MASIAPRAPSAGRTTLPTGQVYDPQFGYITPEESKQFGSPGAALSYVNGTLWGGSDPTTAPVLGTAQAPDKNAFMAGYAGTAPPSPAAWDVNAFRNAWLGTGSDVNAQNALLSQYGLSIAPNGTVRLPDGTMVDLRYGAKAGINSAQWLVHGGETANTPAPSGVAGNPNVFTDPATKEWEALLRQLVDRMNQPQPTWTPQQLDLMQTQSLDPLERQRTAAKEQQTLRLAQRGITPGSGVFNEAMAAIDRDFNQMRTATQANFATQAIGREDQLFANNEQRALNAVNMFKQIPQYADTRMQLAANTLIPSSPYQMLGLQQNYQQMANRNAMYQNAQSQEFYARLASILAGWFR